MKSIHRARKQPIRCLTLAAVLAAGCALASAQMPVADSKNGELKQMLADSLLKIRVLEEVNAKKG